MIVGVKMKVLLSLLLAVLGCSLAEGMIVSKCQLRDQLVEAFNNLLTSQNGSTWDNLVVKLVCYAELVSGFDTSVVNQSISQEHGGHGEHHTRKRRNAPGPTPDTKLKLPTNSPTPRSTKPTEATTKPKPPITNPVLWFTKSTPQSRFRRAPQDGGATETYYGVFQFSNLLACIDGAPSANICGINCSKLIDNDLSDDINCLLSIITNNQDGFGEELRRMYRQIFKKECKDQTYSMYFQNC